MNGSGLVIHIRGQVNFLWARQHDGHSGIRIKMWCRRQSHFFGGGGDHLGITKAAAGRIFNRPDSWNISRRGSDSHPCSMRGSYVGGGQGRQQGGLGGLKPPLFMSNIRIKARLNGLFQCPSAFWGRNWRIFWNLFFLYYFFLLIFDIFSLKRPNSKEFSFF